MADFSLVTIEEVLKLYEIGIEVELADGEIVGFNEVKNER